ncbi:MAG: hypothetical protein M1834_009036 [Cirrosporium novae-zelandiae]|nr:MAG: hypothetical protein M1834_009036 [Cirrosporium novae-zelandiae]
MRLSLIIVFYALSSLGSCWNLFLADKIDVSDTDLSRSASLLRREDDTCPSGTYTSPDSLTFTTYCDTNLPGNDLYLYSESIDSVERCMDYCSTYQPLCYGIAYNIPNGKCYLKNSSLTADTVSENITHSAIANATQLESYDTTCPYTDSSIQNTTAATGDLPFQIYCGKDMENSDYEPTNVNYSPYHADSLQECMQLCAESHPLCYAVSWNPDMEQGFANCYPKNAVGSMTNRNSGYVCHTAVAQLASVGQSCTNNATYTATSSSEFLVTCNSNIAGNDLNAVHATSISNCIETCNTTSACVAIAYDSTLADGFQNCYLKNATTAIPTSSTNFSSAVLTKSSSSSSSASSSSASSSNSSSSSGSSKAWIAGPVIGAVAVVALVGVLGFCRRRRRSRRAAGQGAEAAVGGVDGAAVNPKWATTDLGSKDQGKGLGGDGLGMMGQQQPYPVHEMAGPEAGAGVHELQDGDGGKYGYFEGDKAGAGGGVPRHELAG